MLSPEEFSAGRLRDAKPMSLLISASKHQPSALVVGLPDNKLLAVVLDGIREFTVFDCSNNNAWRGMLVHPVSIEVDERSLFDLDRFDPPLGSITRKGDTLSLSARSDEGFLVSRRVVLIGGLATANGEVEIGFTSWRIVVGHGTVKRSVFVADRPKPTGN